MKKILLVLLCLVVLPANENYFNEASQRFGVDSKLLASIAKIESNNNLNAVNLNTNGTLDIGIMQINSVHLPYLARLGIKKEDLFNPRININFGAFILAKCIDKYGLTINGLNCYNGKLQDNEYAMKVLKQFIKLEYK